MDERFKEPYSEPRWWWEGKFIPACFECTHFRGWSKSKGAIHCLVFPDGISRDVMTRDPRHEDSLSNICESFKQYET